MFRVGHESWAELRAQFELLSAFREEEEEGVVCVYFACRLRFNRGECQMWWIWVNSVGKRGVMITSCGGTAIITLQNGRACFACFTSRAGAD